MLSWFKAICLLLTGVVLIFVSLWMMVRGLALFGIVELLNVSESRLHWVNASFAVLGGLSTWLYARPIAIWSLHLQSLECDSLVYKKVCELAEKLNIVIPNDIYIFDSQEVNVIAIGPSSQFGVIALSRGLLDFSSDEVRDHMVLQSLLRLKDPFTSVLLLLRSMTLVFTLLPARMLVFMLGTSLRTAEDDTPSDGAETMMTYILEWVLIPIPALYLRWLGRTIQKRADDRTLGMRPNLTSTYRLLHELPLVKETRELFSQPFKVGSKKASWLSYHLPYKNRVYS